MNERFLTFLGIFSVTTKKSKSSSNRAFSLIEVSIVLLIIGILIAATISAKALIKNSRIAAAQSKTRAAPINSIPNSVIWLESSLESSFANEEAEDGTDLNSWNDIKSGSAAPINNGSAGSMNPIYSNTINSIQAVKFAGDANSYFEIDGSALNNSDYTIILLEKRQGDGANYFLSDDSTSTDDNETIQLGYSASGEIKHSQGSGNEYTSSLENYSASNQTPKIFVFIQNASMGKKTYINGFLAAENTSDTTQLTGINKLHLGKNYSGEIGEFVIFDRALKNEERKSIEKYLMQKWRMDSSATSLNDQNCTSGTISSTGCDDGCSVNINGSLITSLASGSSAYFSCNATGYTGNTTEEYTCNAGVLSGSVSSAPPAVSQCVDDNPSCAGGYINTGSACVLGCTVNVIGSTLNSTSIANGVNVTCDATGYDGLAAGTCSAPTAVSGTCGCDADNDYIDSDSNGSCEKPCVLSSADSGISSDVNILSGQSTYDCSSYDGANKYNGTLTLTSVCTDGSSVAVDSGSCALHLEDFVSVWRTTAPDESITLPLISEGSYNFTIDWGDSSATETITSSSATHAYTSAGDYTVTISGGLGDLEGWRFDQAGDKDKIIEIKKWGILSFGSNASHAFNGCSNLVVTATDSPILTGTTDIRGFFGNCSSLVTVPSLGNWDTSAVIHMDHFFVNATNFDEPSIVNLDTSSVQTTTYMFQNSTAFNQPIGAWDTSKVNNLGAMLEGTSSFDQDLSNWNIDAAATSTNPWIFNDMLKNSGLSVTNYDAFLTAFAAKPALATTCHFPVHGLQYSAAAVASRNTMISKGWSITNDSLAP